MTSQPVSLIKTASTPTTQPTLEPSFGLPPPPSSRPRAGSFIRSIANPSPQQQRRHSTYIRSPSISDALHQKLTAITDPQPWEPPLTLQPNTSSASLSETNWANKYEDFDIKEAIGFGSSANVYRATYLPLAKEIALKVIDLDMFERNQIDELRRETALMALSKHPNVLKVYGSFVHGSKLYIITPYLSFGSCLDIMKTNFPDGFEEISIATILKQTLEGLAYLHKNGHIHRDVKAGNLLMDETGTVLLADFGVSSSLSEKGDVRKTFVGTPCWMAPEVMEQATGYDFKADIWSFGITAIELATGHAPFAKFSPLKVLKLTLSNAPPTLDREHTKHKYSKIFQDMIDTCLQKNPGKRPTAEKLLQHPYFKLARKKEYLCKSILASVPPLNERPHKRIPETRISIQDNTQWDFDEPFSTSEPSPTHPSPPPITSFAPASSMLTSSSTAGASKRHISFSDKPVVHDNSKPKPRSPDQTATPPASSSTSSNSSMSPVFGPVSTVAPVPSKKSRFIIGDLDADPTQVTDRPASPHPIHPMADDSSSAFVTHRPEDLLPLGISSAPTSKHSQQRLSISSQDSPESILAPATNPARHVAFQVDATSALLRTASSENLPERKSRFEVQHAALENSPLVLAPLSRESSNSSLPPNYLQQHRGSRFSLVEKTAVVPPDTTAAGKEDSRKVGRFELTKDNSTPPSSSATSITPPPTSGSSSATSTTRLSGWMDLPSLCHQLETLLKQTDAQKALVHDLMSHVGHSLSASSSQSGSRSRAVSFSSAPESLSSVEQLQMQLAHAHRDKEKLLKENESLKRDIEMLRQKRVPLDQ
ncbi:kinase-like protein [Hesseltinella vesiculosa]|uniref:Kinase-like protein n=1 Tax=Hesseltinella vesiculosa TaxID=101127 RepID=A0A1X2GGZ9_9FUNG|nr:kinase-like protein [Hesseltinella vesiculosa]